MVNDLLFFVHCLIIYSTVAEACTEQVMPMSNTTASTRKPSEPPVVSLRTIYNLLFGIYYLLIVHCLSPIVHYSIISLLCSLITEAGDASPWLELSFTER